MKIFQYHLLVILIVLQLHLLHHPVEQNLFNYLSSSLDWIGFRSNSRSSTIQTTSLVGCIANTEIPVYANVVTIDSSKLAYHIADVNKTPNLRSNQQGWYPSSDVRKKISQDNYKRANVIKEIYKTEHDYLGHLKNLVDVSYWLRRYFLKTNFVFQGLFKKNAFTYRFIFWKTNWIINGKYWTTLSFSTIIFSIIKIIF